jgi:multidrug efflux pump subunit AcrB
VQPLDYPAVAVDVDRERAGLSGVTAAEVARSLVSATSSSRFVVPVFWADPNTGIGYQVQVEIPPYQMKSAEEIGLVPVKGNGDGGKQLLLRDVAQVRERKDVGEYDRYNMRRMVSMTANIQDEDLGRVAAHLASALQTVNQSQWAPYEQEPGKQVWKNKTSGELLEAAQRPATGPWAPFAFGQGKSVWKNAISGEIVEAPKRPATPPRGLQVDVRGQVIPMQQMFGGVAGGVRFPALTSWSDWLRFAREFFQGLTLGLSLAVVAIILLLAAYFQSVRLALVSVSAVPAVIAGVTIMLWVTGTTLNIQSFMGSIMAIGVAVANAILLVTFAERGRKGGASSAAAAVEGAQSRLRPILMTSCAMLAGMVPMALGIGEGGEQVAPLGRAVIGGLGAATLATLIVLPSVFTVVQGKSSTASASLDPGDPESRFFVRRKPHPEGAATPPVADGSQPRPPREAEPIVAVGNSPARGGGADGAPRT